MHLPAFVVVSVIVLSVETLVVRAEDFCLLNNDIICEGGPCPLPRSRQNIPNDVIILFGNKGAGETPLVHYLIGDDAGLRTAELDLSSADYHINSVEVDVRSKSTVPRLFQDEDGFSLYNFPGFNDKRNPCTEINDVYDIKDLVRRVSNVKVVLVAPYDSVHRDQHGQEFLGLLLGVARILVDVNKFSDSLGLVISEANQLVESKGLKYALAPEERVVENAAAFLKKNVKPYLEAQIADVRSEEQDVHRRALAILDLLLSQHGQRYPRLGVFRAPTEEGDLTQSGQLSLRHLIHDVMAYAQIESAEDFKFDLSDETNLYLQSALYQLQDSIENSVGAIADGVRKWCTQVEAEGNNTVTAQMLQSTMKSVRNLTQAAEQHPAPLEFSQQFLDWQPPSSIDPEVLQGLGRQCNDLAVLQNTSNSELQQMSSSTFRLFPLQELISELEERFNVSTKNVALDINYKIAQSFDNACKAIRNNISVLQNQDFATTSEILKGNLTTLNEVELTIRQHLSSPREICNLPQTARVLDTSVMQHILRHCDSIAVYESMSGTQFQMSSTSWLHPLEDLIFHLQELFNASNEKMGYSIQDGITQSFLKAGENIRNDFSAALAEHGPFPTSEGLKSNITILTQLALTIQQHSSSPRDLCDLPMTSHGPDTTLMKHFLGQCNNIALLESVSGAKFQMTTTFWLHHLDELIFNLQELFNESIAKTGDSIEEEIAQSFVSACEVIWNDISALKEQDLFTVSGRLHGNLTTLYKVTLTIRQHSSSLLEICDLPKTSHGHGMILMQHILSRCTRLQALQDLSDQNLLTSSESLLYPVEELTRHVEDLYSWYLFLEDSYHQLSSYDVQSHWLDYAMQNPVEQHNVDAFLQKMSSVLPQAKQMATQNVDNLKLAGLNQVIDSTFQKLRYTCDTTNRKLRVQSDFIRLSSVATIVCHGYNKLEVFALNTVFIDNDVYLAGEGVSMAIVSPRWVVAGEHTITLKGQDAQNYDPNQSAGKKMDGLAGRPGGQGGSFLGIGMACVGGDNLTVRSIGGKGGRGQKGGHRVHYLWGSEAGGNGGHGGHGGLGGNPQIIELREASGMNSIRTSAQRGETGEHATGGRIILKYAGSAFDGYPHQIGASRRGMVDPPWTSPSWGHIGSEYELYVNPFLNDRVRGHVLVPFRNAYRLYEKGRRASN